MLVIAVRRQTVQWEKAAEADIEGHKIMSPTRH